MNIRSHRNASETWQTQILEDAPLAVQWITCLMRTGAPHFTRIEKQFLDVTIIPELSNVDCYDWA
jgi:hypothetical protein